MKRRILITGGAGFIGSHLTTALVNIGYEVDIIDNLLKQVHGDNPETDSCTFPTLPKNITLIRGDASDTYSYVSLFDKTYDAIVCLAAETGTGQSMYQAAKYCKTNVGSIALLNDLIVQGKMKTNKLILASSRSVYGEASLNDEGEPIASKEDDLTLPKSVYAMTKLAQENLIIAGFSNTPAIAFRFQNVYGPGQSLSNPYTGILSIFSTAIRNKNKIEVFEDGLMSRDFVYIDDVIGGLLQGIQTSLSNSEKIIINLGTGVRTTVLDVVNTLQTCWDSKVEIKVTGLKRAGDIRHNFADISRLLALGYQPKVDFMTGVEKFVKWADSQKINADKNSYIKSLEELKIKNLLK